MITGFQAVLIFPEWVLFFASTRVFTSQRRLLCRGQWVKYTLWKWIFLCWFDTKKIKVSFKVIKCVIQIIFLPKIIKNKPVFICDRGVYICDTPCFWFILLFFSLYLFLLYPRKYIIWEYPIRSTEKCLFTCNIRLLFIS